jgi:hypothetical protein
MRAPDPSRWPLLATGAAVLTAAVALPDPSSAGVDPRSLLLGVGCQLVGAGTILVAWGHADPLNPPPPRDPSARTRATDDPADTPEGLTPPPASG